MLAIVFRCLLAGKQVLERRWADWHLQRRYIKVRGKSTESARIDADAKSHDGTLITASGIEQDVRVVRNRARPVMPFRLSVDVPRAAYVTVTAGVGYLLYDLPLRKDCGWTSADTMNRMLAVMTFNVGYFLSVLGGIFTGELALGRYVQSFEH